MDLGQKNRSRLVSDLCWNHATSALGEALARRTLRSGKPGDGRRVIVVLGAGASHALHSLMTGRAAALAAEKELRFSDDAVGHCPQGGRKALFEAQLEELSQGSGLDKDEFETRFLAMSRLDRRGTLAAIQRFFGARYRPSLGYELLAHMLNHRFFEAVITFNFDELFDEALRGEMRDRDYVRVVSGDDCQSARNWTASGRPARPILVKPHGTVTREETLRFTHSDYLHLPPDIRDLLQDLIFSEQPVALWVIGFAMNSPEFKGLLRSGATRNPEWARASRIYLTLRECDRNAHGARDLGIPCSLVPCREGEDLAELIESVWGMVDSRFRPEFRPRSINRHKFLSSINWAPQQEQADYLRQRVLAELILAVSKAKGWVSFSEIANGRAGFYFSEQKRETRNAPQGRSLLQYCEDLGLKSVSYSPMSLHVRPPDDEDWRELSVAPRTEVRALLERNRDPLEKFLKARTRTAAEGLLSSIWDGREVEVSATGSRPLEFMFDGAETVSTYTELTWKTHEMLNEDWTALFIIAETGKWLADLPKHLLGTLRRRIKDGRPMALVVADREKKESLLRELHCPEEAIRQMPWWGHNFHMTMILKTEGGVVKPTECLFFSRRLRATTIAPVYLKGQDCSILVDTFVAYWAKADNVRHVHGGALKKAREDIQAQLLNGMPLAEARAAAQKA